MEDYIFIILAIILSIVGAVGRNKNKKSPANIGSVGSQPTRKPNFFDQFMNETFFEETPVSKPVITPVQKSNPVAPRKKTEKNIRQTFLTDESTERNIKRPPSQLAKVESIKKQVPARKNKEIHELMKDFSLRKAIIYSEIIDRKY